MPRDRGSAWREVAEHVGSLGSTIRQHYEARRSEGEPRGSARSGREPGKHGQHRRTAEGRDRKPEEARPSVAAALETLGRQLGSAFDVAGEAFRDPTVREKAVRASRSLADAVEASMADLGAEVRQARDRMGRPRHR